MKEVTVIYLDDMDKQQRRYTYTTFDNIELGDIVGAGVHDAPALVVDVQTHPVRPHGIHRMIRKANH